MANISFSLPLWYDLHAHFRQGELLVPLLAAHHAMGCNGVLAMPNAQPPVAKVFADDPLQFWSIEGHLQDLRQASGDVFDDIILPLYLTRDTTLQMIAAGAEAGLLRACKYYPPHGTTGAEFGWAFQEFLDNGVFAAMAEHDVVLCVHGEEHGLSGEAFFGRESNAEEQFYRERMPALVDALPGLRIVAEHLTTKVGVDFVQQAGDKVAATITPQHLLYNVGQLLQNLKYHLYWLPFVKFEQDREALCAAATAADNIQFFAGTESAPHANKVTACGCAAGCFTGGIAPQLYAEAFEAAGLDLARVEHQTILENFLVANGPRFYRLPVSQQRFTLHKQRCEVSPCPALGVTVRILACIEDPDVIGKILGYLEEKLPGSVLPGLPPSRASPQIGLFD